MKILLVEDNAINREVATDLLHSVNLQVEAAENGLIALDKLAEQRFDLILMDLQMPEMDGLEATKQIRKKWPADELPILAMTANIFLEDRLSCLNVGMNDFVAKPVDPLNLFKSLLKSLPNKEDPQPLKKGNSTQTIQNKLPPSDERTLLTKINGLDLDIVSRNLAGKLDGLFALINKLDTQLARDITLLFNAFDSNNKEKCLEIIHTLKGTVGTLGLVKIQRKVVLIDKMLRDDKLNSALKTQIKALAKLQKKLSQDLEKISFKTNNSETKTTTFNEDIEILHKLLILLKQDNAKANDLLRNNEGNLTHSFGEIIETLSSQITQYNYSEAIITLEEVQNRFSGKTS